MKKQVSENVSPNRNNIDRTAVEGDPVETESFNMPYVPWAWPDDARASLNDRLK